jgi:subtilisin family serine protease
LVIPVSGITQVRRTTLEEQGILYNFQDFPESFTSDVAIDQWGADMIDVEKVDPAFTGDGVYIAVLDTGLKKNWRDYFPEERIVTKWGRSFNDEGVMQAITTGIYTPNVVESNDFLGEHPHGTHVTSTIIGYSIRGTYIAGIAPNAKIIPVKVLDTYNGLGATFGTSYAVAAGIEYVANLAKNNPDSRFVISMSLGSLSEIDNVEKIAIDYAIEQGVVVVASAGNSGVDGMGSPGSYAPVIGVGASGWASQTEKYGLSGEWMVNEELGFNWWLQDVPEDNAYVSYVTSFSSRERPDLWPQELDVVAPGSWIVGPYPVGPGQAHLPWWAQGEEIFGQYFFVGGTSMAAPHVSGVVALMLQANPNLSPAQVEQLLRASADELPFAGKQLVYNIFLREFKEVSWGFDGLNAVGYGLLQADGAVSAALDF